MIKITQVVVFKIVLIVSAVLHSYSVLAVDNMVKGYKLIPGIEAGGQLAIEDNLYWGLTPGSFNPDREWWEYYIEPNLRYEIEISEEVKLFGNLSAVGSGTLEYDAYDTGNTGRLTTEEAYLGINYQFPGDKTFKLSVGAQEFSIGNSMLISNGSSNGFDRGALKLGPRKAWEMAAIGRVDVGSTLFEAFYLDPNENPDNDSENKVFGIHAAWSDKSGNKIGAAYGNVFESKTPAVQAGATNLSPPTIIEGGREGLEFIHLYGRYTPFYNALPDFWIGGDYAYEFNDDINLDAYAGRFEMGYTFKEMPWKPKLSYNYQYFSGDDPDTSDLERFDPLFYNGNPGDWATGSKSTMVFINSNVNAHQLILNLYPSAKDVLSIYYSHIRASEERSPLQFGQATRVTFEGGESTVISGVTDKHLADDIFVKYTRIVNPNTYLTFGVSASFPGKGIDNVFPSGSAPVWIGGIANIVIKY